MNLTFSLFGGRVFVSWANNLWIWIPFYHFTADFLVVEWLGGHVSWVRR